MQIQTFLKRFIRESDEKTLINLLRFATGSDMITKPIHVTFNKTVGLQRTPVGRTCGFTLELSTSYDNYPEFRSELNTVLQSNIWVMDII